MGFFSKIGKGFKKVFKKIGKGIKKVAMKVGKFVSKIGIVGQIALAFILPGVGAFLGQFAGALAASSSSILSGIGTVLQTAGKFAHTVGNAFKTVTEGISSFVGEVGKGMVNKAGSLLGKESLLIPSGPANVTEGFASWMQGVSDNVGNITSPFAKAAEGVTSEVVAGPYRTGIEKIQGGFEDNLPTPLGKESVVIPDVNPLDGDLPFSIDLPQASVKGIVDAETKNSTGLLQKAADYGLELAGKTANTFTNNLAHNAATGIAQQSGILPVPETTINSVTNVVPQFTHDSSAVSAIYEQNGLNYGATYDNRVMYSAAQAQYDARVA